MDKKYCVMWAEIDGAGQCWIGEKAYSDKKAAVKKAASIADEKWTENVRVIFENRVVARF